MLSGTIKLGTALGQEASPCIAMLFCEFHGPADWLGDLAFRVYSRSPKVGNPIASILQSNVEGIPALFGLNPVSNFMGFTVGRLRFQVCGCFSYLWLVGNGRMVVIVVLIVPHSPIPY